MGEGEISRLSPKRENPNQIHTVSEQPIAVLNPQIDLRLVQLDYPLQKLARFDPAI